MDLTLPTVEARPGPRLGLRRSPWPRPTGPISAGGVEFADQRRTWVISGTLRPRRRCPAPVVRRTVRRYLHRGWTDRRKAGTERRAELGDRADRASRYRSPPQSDAVDRSPSRAERRVAARAHQAVSVGNHTAGAISSGRSRDGAGSQPTATSSALDGVDLDIAVGEAVGVIGANGAGKSTLLRVIANLIAPDSGSVSVAGSILPIFDAGAGLHPELSGSENVWMVGRLLGHEFAVDRRGLGLDHRNGGDRRAPCRLR